MSKGICFFTQRSQGSSFYEGEGSLMAFGRTPLFNKPLKLPFDPSKTPHHKRVYGASRLRMRCLCAEPQSEAERWGDEAPALIPSTCLGIHFDL